MKRGDAATKVWQHLPEISLQRRGLHYLVSNVGPIGTVAHHEYWLVRRGYVQTVFIFPFS